MTSYESSLRLQFLQNSASLLCSGSVSTAAHLIVQHNGILHEDYKSVKLRQHESWCNGCGSPRQSRYTKIVKPKYRTSKGKTRPASIASREALVYRCLRCSSRTVQRRPSQPRPLQKATTSIQAVPSTEVPTSGHSTENLTSRPTAESSIKTPSENASSKKRAKARKQGGLQALLASKRSGESTQSSSSLDLLDFLQQ